MEGCAESGATSRGVFLLISLILSSAIAARQQDCRFPSKWEGTWFQSGVRTPIVISEDRLSTKGRCIASDGDKFLVVDDKGACFRCVVIYEKHSNVLQYKETYCHARESLPSLCSFITGDALLFSMFRVDAAPVACPFAGTFTFSYNRGHGECTTPPSSVESCTQDSRLLLRYQACPDVYGSESTVEELLCLATWKEGSSRYLVGKVHHNHATSNEDRYRCFVYEKAPINPPLSPLPPASPGVTMVPSETTVDFRVAQSGDATCNGLFSPMEGSRTMALRKAPSPIKCPFPPWLTAHARWHTLDYRRSYQFHARNTTLRISNASTPDDTAPPPPFPPPPPPAVGSGTDGGDRGGAHHRGNGAHHRGRHQQSLQQVSASPLSSPQDAEMRVVCSEAVEVTGDVARLVTHVTMGCHSGYVCMTFYKRDSHVIEVQTGSYTHRPEEACQPSHFDEVSLPFVTLVTASPEPRECPHMGRFSVTGLRRGRGVRRRRNACDEEEDFTSLAVGCGSSDTMEFRSDCTRSDVISAYSCHGRWEDNGTHFLITTPLSRSSHGARRLCFIYREGGPSSGGVVHFSSSPDSCRRNVLPGVEGALAFNVTSIGQCMEMSSASKTALPFLLIFMGPLLLLLPLPR
ncbi:uncharacterized protein LOC124166762 [Ischnura elegans]|uniref:uncharacterized protein LOC124166762 n=1 Tax=Ischnura elegans TaxID=197161 RepID=UPI001ED8A990|nr:uncharacterized protein LOC124166762 [Ischnura elegans]XP_046400407.1 uncharacterized protein LOC124166762 [Ischnura elegans]